jgi:inosine/xanthosine triphosphatase
MKVIVASRNPVKLRATEAAFGRVFDDPALKLDSISVSSGVSDQPLSDEETRRGAGNRVRNAQHLTPDAAYWVGLEGGVEVIGDRLTAFAWMAVLNPAGLLGEARTVTLPLPPRIKALVDQGIELGDANDRVFSTSNSKQKGGAFGLLTNGIYTRESVYTEALIVALVPFVNALYAD